MRAKHIIIKELRLPIYIVLELASKLENTEKLNAMNPLKVIFLVRDPRAIMASRNSLYPDRGFGQQLRELCFHMGQNIAYFKHLIEISNVSLEMHFLRFEDLMVIDPIGKSRQLFKKLSLPFTVETEKWIRENTNDPTTNTNPFSTTRDSNTVFLKWTNTLNMIEIDIIQKACSNTMFEFGYKTIKTEKLRESFEYNFTLGDTVNFNDFSLKKWSIL